jgi:hypothetical protein
MRACSKETYMSELSTPEVAGTPRFLRQFRKNGSEVVRGSLVTYKGHRLADLRVWTTAADGSDVATRKGLTISPLLLPELRATVDALIAAVEDDEQ